MSRSSKGAKGAPRSPAERSLAAALAANTRWAHEDGRAGTARARAAAESRFVELVDPNRELPAEERQRRAEALRRAHFKRLALLSAKARRERTGGSKA